MSIEDFFPAAKSTKPKRHKRRTPKKDLEAAVKKECMGWLIAHPQVCYVERRNTGAVSYGDGGFMRFGVVGGADIFCRIRHQDLPGYGPIHPQPVEIECKRRDGKGVMSDDQLVFQQEMLDIGVPYLVVTSAEDMAKKLRELGLTD